MVKNDTMRLLIEGLKIPEDELLEWANRNVSSQMIWISSIAQTIIEWYDDSDTIGIYTSGSTGTPKEILLRKSAMRASAKLTIDYFDLKEGAIALLCLPAGYIAGKMMIIRAIIAKMELVCVEPSSLPLSKLYGVIDFVAMTPMQVSTSMDEEAKPFQNVKKVIIGGAPVSPYLKLRLQDMETSFYQTYGMTETITHIALQCLNGQNAQEYFTVLPGVDISTIEGCLNIKADHLDEDIRTTDRVEILGQGQFKWLGRVDYIINSGGVKIQPEIVEKKIQSLFTDPYLILGQKDDLLGERVVLMIESRHEVDTAAVIIDRLRLVLNKYELPKKIYFVDHLIKTPTGKLKRDITLYKV